jgi:hypothetical protein
MRACRFVFGAIFWFRPLAHAAYTHVLYGLGVVAI